MSTLNHGRWASSMAAQAGSSAAGDEPGTQRRQDGIEELEWPGAGPGVGSPQPTTQGVQEAQQHVESLGKALPGARLLRASPRGFATKHLVAKGMQLATAASVGPRKFCLPCAERSGRRESRVRNRGEHCISPGNGERRRNSSEWV